MMKKLLLGLTALATLSYSAPADVATLSTGVQTELGSISGEIVTIGTILIGISALIGIVMLFRRMSKA